MKLTIHVTASGAKRLLIVGSALIVLGTAAVGLAAPHTFASGDLLTAADLNNLAIVTNTKNKKTYSRGAVYFGSTSSTNGAIAGPGANGYAAAKSLCEQLPKGSPSAHMCTGDELLRSVQLGISIPAGWYAGSARIAGTANRACNAWTSKLSTDSGAYWNTPSAGATGSPHATTCDHAAPVLCCD